MHGTLPLCRGIKQRLGRVRRPHTIVTVERLYRVAIGITPGMEIKKIENNSVGECNWEAKLMDVLLLDLCAFRVGDHAIFPKATLNL